MTEAVEVSEGLTGNGGAKLRHRLACLWDPVLHGETQDSLLFHCCSQLAAGKSSLFGFCSPFQLKDEEKLSVCSKLCYGIGGAPNHIAGSATSFYLQIFLLDIAHITPFHASLVQFIGKAMGAVADPVAGFFIGQSKWTRIGRLKPWLVGCTPFITVTYMMMWYLPPFISERVIWYLTFYSLFQALYTLYQVPYSALTMFLSADQKQRDSATAYRMGCEVLGTLIGATVHGKIVASAHRSEHCKEDHSIESAISVVGEQNVSSIDLFHGKEVYMISAGVIGTTYLIGIVALFFGVKEKNDLYTIQSDKKVPFFKGHELTMKDRPYLILTAAFLLISTAVQIEQGNFVLFCTQAAGLRNHFQNLVLMILVSAVLSIPLWQWFLKHFGKKSAACGISWMIPFVILMVTMPNLILAYMVAIVCGLSIAASMLLPWSMLPDVVDHFGVQHPHSRGHETIFYSSYIFFTKISAGIGLGISSFSLGLAGFESGVCTQPKSVTTVLKVLIGAVPPILILIGLSVLVFYPITEKSRKETKYALENMRM
ncbi:sphingosine-1-phosphate transporter MFSD2B [Elgaria multicarinata webbii]|uniref:sphingosine-1-phosphate transporter MFSD2B n=1 Tax=Elgaria multicarinata webbii TaxID=159646 RepID=UPI002FCD3AD2